MEYAMGATSVKRAKMCSPSRDRLRYVPALSTSENPAKTRLGNSATVSVSAVSSEYASTRLPTTKKSARRSEEHTSELQSLAYLVCRLLLEKKKMEFVALDRIPAQPEFHA